MQTKWKFCPQCGITLGSEWKFCAECGHPIGETAPQVIYVPTVWPIYPAPAPYAPPIFGQPGTASPAPQNPVVTCGDPPPLPNTTWGNGNAQTWKPGDAYTGNQYFATGKEQWSYTMPDGTYNVSVS